MTEQTGGLAVALDNGRIEIWSLASGAAIIGMAPDVAWDLGTALRQQALNAGHRVRRGGA